MRNWAVAICLTLLSISAFGQSSLGESEIEAELNAVQGKVEPPPPEIIRETSEEPQIERAADEPVRKKHASAVDEETEMQNRILRRKEYDDTVVSPDRNVNRFPHEEAIFKKPPGPKEGGTIRVPHPRAAQGLIRINKDGSYQYKTQLREKSKSSALKLGLMTPPKVSTDNSAINFESMYGSENVFAVDFDYEWQPFTHYGALGLKVGTGFATVSGSGFFKNQNRDDKRTRSEESYNLFIVPISAFLEYRFEYVRRQWIVPFITGGGTYYGLAEIRDDGKSPVFAGAPAIGGGGGLLFSLSRLDSAGAFTLSQEYGIADMWFVVEARAMQGLSEDIDFTNQTISAGIAVDF